MTAVHASVGTVHRVLPRFLLRTRRREPLAVRALKAGASKRRVVRSPYVALEAASRRHHGGDELALRAVAAAGRRSRSTARSDTVRDETRAVTRRDTRGHSGAVAAGDADARRSESHQQPHPRAEPQPRRVSADAAVAEASGRLRRVHARADAAGPVCHRSTTNARRRSAAAEWMRSSARPTARSASTASFRSTISGAALQETERAVARCGDEAVLLGREGAHQGNRRSVRAAAADARRGLHVRAGGKRLLRSSSAGRSCWNYGRAASMSCRSRRTRCTHTSRRLPSDSAG